VRFAICIGLVLATEGCALVAGLSTDYSTPGSSGDAGSFGSGNGNGNENGNGNGYSGCGPTVMVDDTFSTGIGTSWKSGGAIHQQSGGAQPNVQLVPSSMFEYGTLYHDPVGSFDDAFSVSFRFRVDASASVVGDGFAFAWLDGTGDVTTASDGLGLGVIEQRSGWAFVLDTYQNPNNGDPSAPYYGIVKVDSARGKPGTYDWHVRSTAPLGSSVFGVAHTVKLTVISSRVTVVVDGATVLDSVPVGTDAGRPGPGPWPGPGSVQRNIGFSAATGGASTLSAWVDDVRMTVPNPGCPGAFP